MDVLDEFRRQRDRLGAAPGINRITSYNVCYTKLLRLSRELDSSKVSAEFNQGVLKLRIPKAEHAQPRRIEIQVA